MTAEEPAGPRIAIITSSFNEFITKRLYDGAVLALRERGVKVSDPDIVWVPGCFEIPLALAEIADKRYDAVVCLGAVIKGETPHFDYVAGEAAHGIAKISLEKRLPVGFGVITAETTEQAIERAGGKRGNKGREAALAALDMAEIVKKIRRD